MTSSEYLKFLFAHDIYRKLKQISRKKNASKLLQ